MSNLLKISHHGLDGDGEGDGEGYGAGDGFGAD